MIPALALTILLLLSGCSRDTASPQPASAADAEKHAAAAEGHHDHGAPAKARTGDAARAPSDSKAQCAEHGVPEAECGICHPDKLAALAPGQGLKVRLPSTNSLSILGAGTVEARKGEIAEGVECLAEITFNQNKQAQIVAPVSGIVEPTTVDLGTTVTEGQTIVRLWSASIAEAVAKAVLSHQTLDRERKLRVEKITSEAALQEAEAVHRAACQQLRTLGFSEFQIDGLSDKPGERVLMEVRAPFGGEIVERSAVQGALVEAGKPLYTLVDRSTMWAILQVPESSIGRVHAGQEVELQSGSLPPKGLLGRLTWVSPAVDERTRLVKARAEFQDPNGLLKDRMFATARVLTRRSETAILVPSDAVQRINASALLFVKLGVDLFEARAVRLGAKAGADQEILEGLQVGESVAVDHAFAIKSALLMSQLGAGCADD